MINILSALCLITGLIPVYVSTPKGNSVRAYHLTEMSSNEYDQLYNLRGGYYEKN